MSTYKNIAVVGAGVIGGPIVNALVSEGANVTVITRPTSSSTKAFPEGVKVIPVELTDVSALTAIFAEHKVEVVVSTVAHAALPHQVLLGEAAKKAGLKLFLPSEFGYSTVGLEGGDGELSQKSRFAGYLQEIGLPYLRIFTGGFIPFIPWLTGAGSGKIQILGKGDQKASFTDPTDIAGFTAYVLTHLPPSDLSNKIFRIEGERASLLDIAGYYGSRVTVEHVDGFPGDAFKTFLHNHVETGHGSVQYDGSSGKEGAGLSNALWRDHHWKGIKEVLEL